jgi:methyl-accepting chemotaxis protein
MPAFYQITSNPDDSVDFEFGGVTAHIRGSTWEKNNELAHTFGAYLVQRETLREVRQKSREVERKLSLLSERLGDVSDAIESLLSERLVEVSDAIESMENVF